MGTKKSKDYWLNKQYNKEMNERNKKLKVIEFNQIKIDEQDMQTFSDLFLLARRVKNDQFRDDIVKGLRKSLSDLLI